MCLSPFLCLTMASIYVAQKFGFRALGLQLFFRSVPHRGAKAHYSIGKIHQFGTHPLKSNLRGALALSNGGDKITHLTGNVLEAPEAPYPPREDEVHCFQREAHLSMRGLKKGSKGSRSTHVPKTRRQPSSSCTAS